MAFPVVEATATTGRVAETTSPVSYPATVSPGALIVAIARVAVAGAIGWPTDWTELVEDSSDASDDVTAIAWHAAVGTEDGTTFNVTHGNGKSAYIVYSITGALDPAAQPPQISAVAVGTSASPDPAALTPTGGAKDYLWLWLGGWEGEQTSPPAGTPTNYTDALGASTGTAGVVATNCRVASARRELNAASEDPPLWTISVSDDWTAWTMAIHPSPTEVLVPAAYGEQLGALFLPYEENELDTYAVHWAIHASHYDEMVALLFPPEEVAEIEQLIAAGYSPDVLPPDLYETHEWDISIIWDHRPGYDDIIALLFERDASIEELVIAGYSPDVLPADVHETHELDVQVFYWSLPASDYDDLIAFLFERDASIEELIAGYSPDTLPPDLHENHEPDLSILWDQRPHYDDVLAVLFEPVVEAAIEELIAAGYSPDIFSALEEVAEDDFGPQGEVYEWVFIVVAGLDVEIIIAAQPDYGLLGSPTHEDYYPFDPVYFNIWFNDLRRHRLYWGNTALGGTRWETANL